MNNFKRKARRALQAVMALSPGGRPLAKTVHLLRFIGAVDPVDAARLGGSMGPATCARFAGWVHTVSRRLDAR